MPTLRHLLQELVAGDTDAAIDALRTHSKWHSVLREVGALAGVLAPLTAAVVSSLGGRVFYPVTGGAPTSQEVLDWMTQTFIPLTTTGIDQR